MLYFKFKDNTHSGFSWDHTIKFIGEVTKAEYKEQFKPAPVQLELF